MDDLITKGGSILKAAEAVRAEGGVVTDAVVLMDREENGKHNLAKDGIKLHYLLTMSELAHKLHDMDAITERTTEHHTKASQKKVTYTNFQPSFSVLFSSLTDFVVVILLSLVHKKGILLNFYKG